MPTTGLEGASTRGWKTGQGLICPGCCITVIHIDFLHTCESPTSILRPRILDDMQLSGRPATKAPLNSSSTMQLAVHTQTTPRLMSLGLQIFSRQLDSLEIRWIDLNDQHFQSWAFSRKESKSVSYLRFGPPPFLDEPSVEFDN